MAEAMAAARLGDPVGHSLGVAGMLAGAVAGAVIGAALLGATVLTGGVAGVAAAAAIAGMVGGGALAGGQLVKGLTTVLGLSHPTTGTLARGSPNVRVNGRPAVRAKLDFVEQCTGLYGLQHLPKPSARVAEGSATVRVNGRPAARVKDRLECAADITQGSPNVVIGGPTEAALPVAATNEDVATRVAQGLVVVGLAGAAGLAVVGAASVGGALLGLGKLGLGVGAGYGINEGLGWVGDQLGPGYRDLLQGTFGMGAMLAGPRMARSAQRRATAARVRGNVAASQRARAASGFGGRTPKPGSRAGLTPRQQVRVRRGLANRRAQSNGGAAGGARAGRPGRATARASARPHVQPLQMRSGGDRLLGTMGPARVNHPEEFAAILDDLRSNGVEVSFRPGALAYGPARGRPGNLVLDPDASISAVRHEYGHFLDDKALGFPGPGRYFEQPSLRVATERRQYLQEIKTARELGDDAARRQLILDYLEERNYLIENFYTRPYGSE